MPFHNLFHLDVLYDIIVDYMIVDKKMFQNDP